MTDVVNVTPRRKLFCEGFKPRRDQTGESWLTLHRYGGPLFSDRQLPLKSDGPFRQAYGQVRGVLKLKRCSIGDTRYRPESLRHNSHARDDLSFGVSAADGWERVVFRARWVMRAIKTAAWLI